MFALCFAIAKAPLTLHDRCMFRLMIMFALCFAIAKAPLTLHDRCMFRFMIIFALCFAIEKAPLTLHDRCMFRFMIIFALCFAIEKAHWWGHIPQVQGQIPHPSFWVSSPTSEMPILLELPYTLLCGAVSFGGQGLKSINFMLWSPFQPLKLNILNWQHGVLKHLNFGSFINVSCLLLLSHIALA